MISYKISTTIAFRIIVFDNLLLTTGYMDIEVKQLLLKFDYRFTVVKLGTLKTFIITNDRFVAYFTLALYLMVSLEIISY